MTKRHSASSFARKHAELAWAAPQVIAHRTSRMLASGIPLNSRDSAEFSRMFTEKAMAFTQAWVAACMAIGRSPYHVAAHLLRGGMGLGLTSALSLERIQAAWMRQFWVVAGAGLAPVHRAATANARRLGARRR